MRRGGRGGNGGGRVHGFGLAARAIGWVGRGAQRTGGWCGGFACPGGGPRRWKWNELARCVVPKREGDSGANPNQGENGHYYIDEPNPRAIAAAG
jgi:hypothetical protein